MNSLQNQTRNFTLNQNSRFAKQFESIHALNEFVEAYFKTCEKNNRYPTIANLAVMLGISREDLIEYSGDPQITAALNYAKTRIAATYEDKMLSGTDSISAEVFLLKANHGYTERSLVENRHVGEVKTVVQFELPPRRQERALTANIIDVKALDEGQ